jgi:hypothetical protein
MMARICLEKVAFSMQKVQQEAVWNGVVQAESMWAYADEESFKDALNHVFNNHDEALKTANKLQPLLQRKFDANKLYKGFCSALFKESEQEPEDEIIL